MGALARKQESENDRVVKEMEVQNKLGLHARPAAMFVRAANKFSGEIWVEKDNEEVNGKSIMGLMMLAAGCGSVLKVSAIGDGAEDALNELHELVERKFDED
ncbi:MAG: HPr family phosphocarrier protein [Verrucomicrobiota bacterium]